MNAFCQLQNVNTLYMYESGNIGRFSYTGTQEGHDMSYQEFDL